jgi:hypothetical protein
VGATVLKKYDELDLNHVARHLAYEISMLEHAGSLLPRLSPNHKNAYVECFAIHTRNLIEFYFSKPLERYQKDDLAALQFCLESDPWTKTRADLSKDEILNFALKRANKQVSHLTLDRGEDASVGKSWKIYLILERLRELYVEFLDKCRPEFYKILKEELPDPVHARRKE